MPTYVKVKNTYKTSYVEQEREKKAREKQVTHNVNVAAIAKHIAFIEAGTIKDVFEQNLTEKEKKYKENIAYLEECDKVLAIVKEVYDDIEDKIDDDAACRHYDALVDNIFKKCTEQLVELYSAVHTEFKPYFNGAKTEKDFCWLFIAAEVTSIRISVVIAKKIVEFVLTNVVPEHPRAPENLHIAQIDRVLTILTPMMNSVTKRVTFDMNNNERITRATRALIQVIKRDDPDLYHIAKSEIDRRSFY